MPSTRHLDQNAASKTLDRGHIPNLDLSPLFGNDPVARGELEGRIRTACLETGFFYVHNSCLDESVIRDTLDVAREFFRIPDHDSLKQAVHNRHAGDMKGWGPLFGEPAYQPGTVAHVESFDLGQQLSRARYDELGIEPNIWPDIAGFRETVLSYYESVTTMVLFFALDGDCEVAPLPQFTGPDEPALYAPVTQDDHISKELERAAANRQTG